jgi:deoxyxylulose-5-phosphate synthase
MTTYSLLSRIDSPADLRRLSRSQLGALAVELREYVLQSVSQTGGHLSSNLGTVELTIALHYVFAWSGTSATRPMRTRSSPAGATACTPCAS